MIFCDFSLILSSGAVVLILLAIEIGERELRLRGNSRLFWCKKCGEFYLNKPDLEICECPICGTKNSKLSF
jgi:Zn finger protein HypA/HybF involved in hydrogenase expression